MEKSAEIIINDEVYDYLQKLIHLLYKKDYFSFIKDAESYVITIINKITNSLPKTTHRLTPLQLKKYGNFYIKLKGTRRTTWYAFFDKKDNRYYIEFITNNHSPKASFFNEL